MKSKPVRIIFSFLILLGLVLASLSWDTVDLNDISLKQKTKQSITCCYSTIENNLEDEDGSDEKVKGIFISLICASPFCVKTSHSEILPKIIVVEKVFLLFQYLRI